MALFYRLVKSGVMAKRHQPRITLISAWAELVRLPDMICRLLTCCFHDNICPRHSSHAHCCTAGRLLREHHDRRAHCVVVLGARGTALAAAARCAEGMTRLPQCTPSACTRQLLTLHSHV